MAKRKKIGVPDWGYFTLIAGSDGSVDWDMFLRTTLWTRAKMGYFVEKKEECLTQFLWEVNAVLSRLGFDVLSREGGDEILDILEKVVGEFETREFKELALKEGRGPGPLPYYWQLNDEAKAVSHG